MNKLIISAGSIFFLTVSLQATAQNNTAPQKPEAKIVTANQPAPTATNKTNNNNEKQLAAKPIVLPLQKAEQPKTDQTVPASTPELTGVSVGANTQKGLTPKNIDRPKTSTLTTAKAAEPVTMPAPKLVKPDNK